MEKQIIRAIPLRITALKEELFETKSKFCFQRALIVTNSYKKTEGEHQAIRRAKALRDVFSQIPIFIRKDELIVGQRSEALAGRSVYPEYNLFGLSKESTPSEIWEYWQGNNICDIVKRVYPKSLKLAENEMACGFVVGANSGFGHVIIDYEKAIKKGFNYIIDEAKGQLEDTKEDDLESRAFLEAVIISSQGIIKWANRYGDLAMKEAQEENDPKRKKELLHICDICHRVPAMPASNFQEALQSFWFVHIAMHIEQNGWSISAGRFDQYMYSYFKNDIASNALSMDEAWELLLNLWVKFMENISSNVKDTIFQNLTLGGRDINGNDMSNALSTLCLQATVALRFNQPALSVRWHKNINEEFWQQVQYTIAEGMGLPALFNDEIIIPALISHGVEIEDATSYGLVGCVETCVPGKQQGVTAGGHINCAKALELALNGGRSMISNKQIGTNTKNPSEFIDFNDLWLAYKDQIEYLVGLNVLATHISGEVQKQYGYCPLMSALLDDCIKNKKDMVYGGTRYNLPGVGVFGPSNTCDGMMAIKKWVCDEKKLTFKELQQILLSDFEGNENIRLLFFNKTPRFGNDIIEADELNNSINALHAELFWKHVDSRNGRYTCGVWPVNNHVNTGRLTAATPDGRHKGMPLVDGVGACQGADKNGPTALINSVARLNNIYHWTAGNTFNMKFSATAINTNNGIDRMKDLITTFMKLGGQELQVNVVDAKTLHAALENPKLYKDLVIRVAGYSAYFTQLNNDVQIEIISRMEQTI